MLFEFLHISTLIANKCWYRKKSLKHTNTFVKTLISVHAHKENLIVDLFCLIALVLSKPPNVDVSVLLTTFSASLTEIMGHNSSVSCVVFLQTGILRMFIILENRKMSNPMCLSLEVFAVLVF